jgi:ubiquinone/menaquinone biosynthesis C-methylase UbiE
MFVKRIVKWCVPYGIYQSYINKKKTEHQKIITHRGFMEFKNEGLTKAIGDDWKNSPYYDMAEEYLDGFWNENSVFNKCFKQLDCGNIVELACGHGRHVQRYLENAQSVILVDINQENIDYCKKRYSDENKIKYLVNDGNNFKGIDTNSQTAIFTYDAMVHFEMMDIIEYLKESNRILIDGGKILFHHSNAAFSPELFYHYKPHWRNYMSADIFAYLALRCGFRVISQDIMSWGGGENFVKDLDCLSLCQKIYTV